MKLIIDIPEWAEETRIVVIAGVEEIARYHRFTDPDNVYVKDVRCNRCGACCKGFTPRSGYATVDGYCIHLHPTGNACIINNDKPLNCCLDPNIFGAVEPECCITHKKIPIVK